MSVSADHAIVRRVSADDDREIRARMAALEAEVKAEADTHRARKEQALAKLRAQKQKQLEERAALQPQPKPKARPRNEDDDELDTAMMVARGAKLAKTAKDEISRPRAKGEKSWLASSALSLFLGPIGWTYAGSLREAIPAGVLWLIAMAILSKLPWILVMPVIMVALPISAIGGFVYALQYNRHGKRMRLFDKDEKKKLPSGES
jgi:hypothetical protein